MILARGLYADTIQHTSTGRTRCPLYVVCIHCTECPALQVSKTDDSWREQDTRGERWHRVFTVLLSLCNRHHFSTGNKGSHRSANTHTHTHTAWLSRSTICCFRQHTAESQWIVAVCADSLYSCWHVQVWRAHTVAGCTCEQLLCGVKEKVQDEPYQEKGEKNSEGDKEWEGGRGGGKDSWLQKPKPPRSISDCLEIKKIKALWAPLGALSQDQTKSVRESDTGMSAGRRKGRAKRGEGQRRLLKKGRNPVTSREHG